MRGTIIAATVAIGFLAALGAHADDAPPPAFAYPFEPPPAQPAPPAPDNGEIKRVPGSAASYTISQIRDLFNGPDWHPDDHPAMPEVVAHGRKPAIFGCGYCHQPNGLGRPENASVAGLSSNYILQQLEDFKSGARKSSDSRLRPPALMIAIAKAVTDADAKEAAAYFSSIKLKPWIRVIEAAQVPKSQVSGGMFVPVASGGTEPIGHRILEMPEDLPRTQVRDSQSGFVAYVPPGSIRKGEALVTKGGAGKTVKCETCHGPGLKGLGPVPALAGRSPSYIVRQLYDIQHGARAGAWTPLMAPVVANLTEDDMVAIAAYTASRAP